MTVWRKLKYLLPWRRRAEEQDMQEELNSLRRMAGPNELGNLTYVAESARDVWTFNWLEDVLRDLRYSVRALVRDKSFTLAAAAMLALGIGANTAVFSVFDAIMIQELPVRQPDELVAFEWLRTRDSMFARYSGSSKPGPNPNTSIRTSFSYRTLELLRDHNHTFSDVFAFAPVENLNVVAEGQADTASGQLVTGNYFTGLGVTACEGRTLTLADDNPDAEPFAVISHRYWKRRFGGDPKIVGKSITINGFRFVIAGVSAEGFHGTRVTESRDITLPITLALHMDLEGMERPIWLWWVQLMGRLRPGITREQALADVQGVFAESVRESWNSRPPETPNPTRTGMPQLRVIAGRYGPEGPPRDAAQMFLAFFAIVGAVLLIGCVNLANLLMARGSTKRQEILMRFCLGSSRWRVVRQLLAETMLLAVAGGTIGVVAAFWGKDFLSWLPNPGSHVVIEPTISFRVLAFTASLSTITAIAFGIGPALRATRTDFSPPLRISLQKGGVQHGSVRKGLMIAQMAICLVLLVGAGLLIRTLRNLSAVDPGFDPDNFLLFQLDPGFRERDPAKSIYEQVASAIETVPGVMSATFSAYPLLAGLYWTDVLVADTGGGPQDFIVQNVRYNFLETMGIPLLKGRRLSPGDNRDAPRVAIINEAAARQLFKDVDPIGHRLKYPQGPLGNQLVEVVGIVRNTKCARLEEPVLPMLYRPYEQVEPTPMTFEVRTTIAPGTLIPAVRQAIQRIAPHLAMHRLRTQREQIADSYAGQRVFAILTSVFGALGLLLACVGLYGIVSFNVTQRTSEIGIRMALGAQRRDVLRLVLRETVLVAVIGAAVGSAIALAVSRLIASAFFGVAPSDPLTLASAVVLLIAVATLAGYLPARRALQLDPMHALRYE